MTFAAIVALCTSTASAQAATETAATGHYCVTILHRIQPGQPDAVVQSRTCTDSAQQAKTLAPASTVPLVTLYQNSGLDGYNDTLYGDAGPCDPVGYGFSNLSYENDVIVEGISSYQTYSGCNGQQIFSQTGYGSSCGIFGPATAVDVPWACNDHIYSMKVYAWFA
ncbi:MAG TPA: hypothetical protein VJ870_03115 [Amycolatopsis sp.]|nr:hypothetical protein [Amycolatopsis sp.]